nr:soluble scavenger receptor cysteine-rich domain-containing protein SSC5D-like [Lytechinus pictus]
MDRQQYIDEAMKHLNNRSHYALLDSDPTCNFSLQIQSTLNDMKEREYLSEKAHKFLSLLMLMPCPLSPPESTKPGNPGRPILSGNGSSTENISPYQNKRTANGLNVSLGSSEWAVRLVDRYENVLPSSGIVQVFLNGSWGDICFSNWDRRDADVACRCLGFSGSFHTTNVDDYKPASSNVLFDMGCLGYESSFAECNYSRTNAPKECRIPYKASASCTNFTRLE